MKRLAALLDYFEGKSPMTGGFSYNGPEKSAATKFVFHKIKQDVEQTNCFHLHKCLLYKLHLILNDGLVEDCNYPTALALE